MQAVPAYTLSAQDYARAIEYAHLRYALHFASVAVSVLALVVAIRFRLAVRLGRSLLVIVTLLLLVPVANLPVDTIRHAAALRFGISVQSWPAWIWDWSKEQAIGMILGVPVVWGFYSLLRRSPGRWWIYAWLAALPVMIASAYLEPWLIEPLFDTFTPLARHHPELIGPIQGMLTRAGVAIPAGHLFEMEASSKTNSLNAYVSGFGPSRRVVLYDTIIAKEKGPALLTTFGHELGHYVLNHIPKGLVFGALLLLILGYCAFRIIPPAIQTWGGWLGVRAIHDLTSLPMFLLFFTLAGFFSEPLVNAYSRHQEHEADVYSLEITHDLIPGAREAAARAFQIEGETDLDEPAPNPLIVFWLYTHPPTADRLRFALTYDPWLAGRSPSFVR